MKVCSRLEFVLILNLEEEDTSLLVLVRMDYKNLASPVLRGRELV